MLAVLFNNIVSARLFFGRVEDFLLSLTRNMSTKDIAILEGKITRLSSELKQLESVCLEMKAKLAAQDELSQENKMTRNLSICLVLLFTAYLIHDNMESFVAKMFDTGIVVGNIIQDKIWMCIGFIRDSPNTVSSIYLSFASGINKTL